MRIILGFLVAFAATMLCAENSTHLPESAMSLPSPSTEAELWQLFADIEQELATQKLYSPVSVRLQEQAIKLFDRGVYRDNKKLVDTAARLSALGYLELQVNQREMHFMHLEAENLPAFVAVDAVQAK